MTKKMTMAEISKQLGISKMTVSRYFNGGYVSEENRQKIDAIVTANHYVPNQFARSIRSQSNIIGFIAPRIESYTTSLVIKGALAAAVKHKAKMLFHATGFDHDSEIQTVREFHGLNALGTILIPTKFSVKETYYDRLNNLVFIGKKMPNRCCLYYPEQEAIEAMVNTTIKGLRQKNAMIQGIQYVYDERMLSSRTALIEAAVMSNKCPPHFQHIPLADSEDKSLYQSIQLKPNHIYFCATDNIAIRLYRLAKEQKRVIGRDLWVLGVGDYQFSDLLVPSLSSLSFNYYEMGFQAVMKLVKGDFTSREGEFTLKTRESSQFL